MMSSSSFSSLSQMSSSPSLSSSSSFSNEHTTINNHESITNDVSPNSSNNSTFSNSSSTDEIMEIMDQEWIKVLITVFTASIMIFIIVAAIFGNLLVIISVMRVRKLRYGLILIINVHNLCFSESIYNESILEVANKRYYRWIWRYLNFFWQNSLTQLNITVYFYNANVEKILLKFHTISTNLL